MAFYRSTYRPRRTMSNRKYYKRPRVARPIRRFRRPLGELKNNTDSIANNLTVATPMIFTHISAVSQGLTEANRIGNQISLKSALCQFNLNTGTASLPVTFRCVLFRSISDIDGATPTLTNMFVDATNINSPLNLQNSRKWKIIRDKMITLDPLTSRTRTVKMYSKLFGVENYTGVSGTNFDKGALFLLIWADGMVSAEVSNYEGYSRVRYTDI